MTSLQPAQLVRVSVHGPAGRADLAVPSSTSVADLLPVLLQHTSSGNGSADEQADGVDWVLQRVGGPVLDADGTPETLDWLEGEQFHLRPAADPMPELDFDDVADGVATAVGRRPDRWRPEFSRWLFLGATLVASVVGAAVVADPGDRTAALPAALALCLVLACWSVAMGRTGAERAAVAVPGVAACAFAWVAGALGAGGDLLPVPAPTGALAAGGALAAAGAVFLVARATIAPALPLLPFATAALGGAVVASGCALHLAFGLDGAQAAGLVGAGLLGLASVAPRVVLRFARLHGPQLPRTAEDLQSDVEPLPAAEVFGRTADADRYLSALMIVTGGALATAAVLLLRAPGWAPATLVALFATASALRARVHLTVAQRIPLAAAAVGSTVLLVWSWAGAASPVGRVALAVAAVIAAVLCHSAAQRPAGRRPRPVWGHAATVVEVLAAVALLPVLLQVVGAYAWARGLAG